VDKATLGWKVAALFMFVLILMIIFVISPDRTEIKRLQEKVSEFQAEFDKSYETIKVATETNIWGRALQKELVHKARQLQILFPLLEEAGITIVEKSNGVLVVRIPNGKVTEIPPQYGD
jgi:predicted Holliday junction resolvase-like endonuclease